MVEILFRSLKGDSIKLLDKYKPGAWINVVDPEPAALAELCEDLHLDLPTVKDALDPYEVPRIERENGSDYIFIRTPVSISGQVHTVPLLFIITADHFITVSKDQLDFISKYRESRLSVSTTQKTKLFMMLLLDINTAYSHMINDMRKKVRFFTSDLQKVTNRDLVQLVDFQSVFNDFLSSLEPLSITLNQLLSGKYLRLFESDQDMVEDLQIGTNQLVQLCRSNIKAITNIRDAYVSIASNNLNQTVKLLTAVTLILTIPTAIASFFGMNVSVPLANHPLAFAIIIIITLTITSVIWIWFWKKDYL
jgi:magnesium transporter